MDCVRSAYLYIFHICRGSPCARCRISRSSILAIGCSASCQTSSTLVLRIGRTNGSHKVNTRCPGTLTPSLKAGLILCRRFSFEVFPKCLNKMQEDGNYNVGV